MARLPSTSGAGVEGRVSTEVPLDAPNWELPCKASLKTVLSLVEDAGEELLGFRQQLLDGELAIEKKGFRDLVTDADHASESHLVDGLKRLFPGDSIYSEESGEIRTKGDRRWILDPLDGTTNFSHGHPFFSISAGLWDRLGPLAAVIHAPLLGESWWAIRGQGCWHLPVTGEMVSLRLVDNEDLSSAFLATGFSYGRSELEHGALDLFRELLDEAREIRRGGSAALDLAHTAAGVFDGFWEFRLAPHDVAAGALLVMEAGGWVTDGFGGDDWLHGGSIVAGVPTVQRRILDKVQPVAASLSKMGGSQS